MGILFFTWNNSRGFGEWETIASKNTLDNRSIEFEIDAADKLFVDPQHSYLKTTLRIRNVDNTPIEANAEVSVINYIGATLFKQVDFFMGNNLIQSSNCYHYQGKLEVELSYNICLISLLVQL